MSLTTARLVEIIQAAGLRPWSYSGRFMYGRRCVAIDASNHMLALADLIEACTPAETTDLMGGLKLDDFGLGKVLYWPDVPMDKDP